MKSFVLTLIAACGMLAIVFWVEIKAMKRRQRLKDTRPPIDPRTIIKAVKDHPPMTRMPERDERK